jgi:hypothetical protein
MKINRDSIWITNAREKIPIRLMSESHIKNSIRLILESGIWRKEYLKVLEQELELRKTPLFKVLNE